MTNHPANPLAARTRPGRPPRAGSRGGIVLFIVMIVIVMISLAGLSFVMTMSTENKAVHLAGDELQIEQVAASGEELLKAFCELSRDEREQAGGSLDNPGLFRGVLVVDDDLAERRARFSIVSPRIEEDRITGIRFGAANESARLNLVFFAQWEEEQPGAARDALMNLPGMTDSIADAILDWIDVDPTPSASGAEAEYYASLGVPYRPRNGVPTSLEELLLIRDVSRELLFGPDADFNYQAEEAELQLASGGSGIGAGQGELPWASLLTVYSAERNASAEGSPRIHLNEKDLAKLHEQLSEAFDPEWAKFIIAYRQFGPYEEGELGPYDEGELGPYEGYEGRGRGRRGPSVEEPFSPPRANRARPAGSASPRSTARTAPDLDLSLPPKFNIDSVLDLVGVEVRVGEPEDELEGEPEEAPPGGPDSEAPLPEVPKPRRRPPSPDGRPPLVLKSPFEPDPLAMRDYLPKLVDQTTVTADKVIRGRINVNEAPRAVLLGVPGLERSTVDQIISARGLRPDQDDPARRDPTWLLTEGIVDLDRMKELMPYLTTGGDVYRAQVVGYFEGSGPSARAEVVVDGTTSPPRQVYWKNLRLLGRGFSLETLGAEPPTDNTRVSTGPASPVQLPQLD